MHRLSILLHNMSHPSPSIWLLFRKDIKTNRDNNWTAFVTDMNRPCATYVVLVAIRYIFQAHKWGKRKGPEP